VGRVTMQMAGGRAGVQGSGRCRQGMRACPPPPGRVGRGLMNSGHWGGGGGPPPLTSKTHGDGKRAAVGLRRRGAQIAAILSLPRARPRGRGRQLRQGHIIPGRGLQGGRRARPSADPTVQWTIAGLVESSRTGQSMGSEGVQSGGRDGVVEGTRTEFRLQGAGRQRGPFCFAVRTFG